MSITRREALTGLAAAGLWAPAGFAGAAPGPRRSLRVAFLTDAHLPGPPGENVRMARVLNQVQAQPDRPDLIVFGGDNVMSVDDSDKTTSESAQAQFDNWGVEVMDRLKCPSVGVIGNHDIFWKDAEAAPPRDPKARALAAFRMPKRYHAHVAGGWKFLLLDTYHADGCTIDAVQFKWLKGELADRSRPVALVSHAPILTATGFFEDKVLDKGQYNIPVGWMVADAAELKDLFLAHPHVRLSLSGHMHQVDRVDYQGVTYICGGAVSGNWWKKDKYIGFGPAYVMLDLFADGTFRHQVVFWE